MEEIRRLCDVNACGKLGARTFRIFKERKADGAGSMENWYTTFDLCGNHAAFVLDVFLDRKDGPRIFDLLDIKTRVE